MPSSSGFHLAVLGDFSARSSRGAFETGAALANRRVQALDIDTLDDVIASYATSMELSFGEDGPVVSIEAQSLDDLHPDTLFETLDVFSELAALRRSLAAGVVDEAAIQKMRSASGGLNVLKPTPRDRASLPTDVPLSAFEALVGGAVAERSVSPVDELLARAVGPYIEAAPDPDAAFYLAAVNQALSGLMALVLHHPQFQSLEAAWRSLDMLARRIDDCRISVIDIAAEEIALDLISDADGFAALLADKEYSAAVGLYTFDVLPTHVDILARIADTAASFGLPFVTGLDPDGIEAPLSKADARITASYQKLTDRETSPFLGLAAPEILMRRPYGKKSDPIDSFSYEEFNENEGLSGMLWGSPALIAGLLLAENHGTGPVLDMDDMPYHVVADRYGDQVTLPATSRMMTETRMMAARTWNVMPLLASRGGDVVRLAGFNSVAGGALAGNWGGKPAPMATPSGKGAGLSLSFSAAELAEIREQTRPKTAGPDPDEIDPNLAALLSDLR